jgi:hypothetical protein
MNNNGSVIMENCVMYIVISYEQYCTRHSPLKDLEKKHIGMLVRV